MSSTQSPTASLARICPICHDIVPLAATTSVGTFYLGWICPRGLAVDTKDCLLDVIGVYPTCEDAKWNLVTEEYYASLQPPDPEVDAIRPLSSRAWVARSDQRTTPLTPALVGAKMDRADECAAGGSDCERGRLAMPSYGTQCFDNLRTGWNPQEYALSPDSMRQKTLCNLGSCVVAGQVYAQPLVVENIALPNGRVGDFLLVATQDNWIYAFDTFSLSQVWARQLLPASEHLVSPPDLHDRQDCDNVSPFIGITSTPVLDPERRLMYVCAKSKKPGGFLGSDSYHHRLYAINVHTGGDWKPPVEVSATIHYGGQTISFNPQWQLQRPGLLLMNQTVYLAFGGHCDFHPGTYHGWVLAYDANTLDHVGAFVSTVSGLGGIWQSGRGLAGDGRNVYCQTGNGPLGGLDLGDSVLKLSRQAGPLLQLNGFFTPCDQQMLRDGDVDLGSGGPLLLPDQPGPFPHLMVAAGKEGTVYLLNRDTSLGGFVPPSPTWKPCDDLGHERPCVNSNIVVSTLWMVLGQAARCDVSRDALFGGPAYYEPALRPGRPRIYYCGSPQGDVVKAFEYDSTSGRLVGPVEQTTDVIGAGAIPVVSSNGGQDGILWVASRGEPDGLRHLYAYDLSPSMGLGDPKALLAKLPVAGYSAEGDGSPSLGPPATVVNGRVYVGCDGRVVVFGLLNRMAVTTTSEVPGRSISLMVTDAATGAPITGAVVTIDDGHGAQGSTDAHGAITLSHRPCCSEWDEETRTWLSRVCDGRVHKDGYCDEGFTTVPNRMAVATTSEVPGRSISLMVTDAATGAPIAGAVVTIDGGHGARGSTDAHGAITVSHRPCREWDGETRKWLPRECSGRVHRDGYCDEGFTTEIPRR